MSYQVIARKWRPQSFDQLIGQSHISQTLANALKVQRIPHALLFTGPRGTGKTSSARILAKSLRCPDAQDFVPCNRCSSCDEISASMSPDVRELDAASNNSVDDMRELLSGVMHMPASGKYKIYIIDEVHMLSTSAFNALLKTLEEPPENVIFILATTEIQKIPQTIISRCQRFDFRRISTREITEHLRKICQQENYQAQEEALWTIARQGDGSMRDAQSLLDQVITFSQGEVTQVKLVQILGLTDRSLILDALVAVCERDSTKLFSLIKKLGQSGTEPKLFIQEFLEGLRNLLVIKLSLADVAELVDIPDSELKILAEISAPLSEEDIHLLFDMAVKGAQDVLRSPDPRLVLEMVLLRMSSAPKIVDLQSLLSHPFKHPETNKATASTVTKNSNENTSPRVKPPPPKLGDLTLPNPEKWHQFVESIKQSDSLFAAKVENLHFVKIENRNIHLSIPPKLIFLKEQMKDSEVRNKLKALIDSSWGPGYALSIAIEGTEAPGESAQSFAAKKKQQEEESLRKQIIEHPAIKEAQSVFKGQIRSIDTISEK